MFSILIPAFNNLDYFELSLNSLKNNSKFNNQIIVHVNIGNDGTIEYLKRNNIEYSYTEYSSGIVAQFIINKSMDIKSKKNYLWHQN